MTGLLSSAKRVPGAPAFVTRGAKINAKYFADSLLRDRSVPDVVPRVGASSCVLAQVGASSRAAKETMTSVRAHAPASIGVNGMAADWPSDSPELGWNGMAAE